MPHDFGQRVRTSLTPPLYGMLSRVCMLQQRLQVCRSVVEGVVPGLNQLVKILVVIFVFAFRSVLLINNELSK